MVVEGEAIALAVGEPDQRRQGSRLRRNLAHGGRNSVTQQPTRQGGRVTVEDDFSGRNSFATCQFDRGYSSIANINPRDGGIIPESHAL